MRKVYLALQVWTVAAELLGLAASVGLLRGIEASGNPQSVLWIWAFIQVLTNPTRFNFDTVRQPRQILAWLAWLSFVSFISTAEKLDVRLLHTLASGDQFSHWRDLSYRGHLPCRLFMWACASMPWKLSASRSWIKSELHYSLKLIWLASQYQVGI